MRCALIMAGGKGERFWPKSTYLYPKQFLNLVGNKSMIKLTFERLADFLPRENIFVIIGEHLVELLLNEIPDIKRDHIIVEPFPRNTAPAIGLGAVYIRKYYGNATMLVTPSDHYIEDLDKFFKCVDLGFEVSEKYLSLTTLGIKPTRPDTGYGYIQVGSTIEEKDGIKVYETIKFVEKPNYEMANIYISSGNFFWNSGMFLWTASTIIDEIYVNLPELGEILSEIEELIGKPKEKENMVKLFERAENISIDYGIMEKSRSVLCIEGKFSWDDVGSWGSVYRLNKKDQDGNLVKGNVVYHNVHNSIMLNDDEGVLAVSNMSNVVVVKENDKIIIMPLDADQTVREIIKYLRSQDKYKKYL